MPINFFFKKKKRKKERKKKKKKKILGLKELHWLCCICDSIDYKLAFRGLKLVKMAKSIYYPLSSTDEDSMLAHLY
jgi:hypothetical protein